MHLLVSDSPLKTACGRGAVAASSDPSVVTCGICQKRIQSERFKFDPPFHSATPGRGRGCFLTKIKGISRRNEDGSNRQYIARACDEGEVLFLVREPTNPADFNAIKVLRRDGQQLGYLPRGVAGSGLAQEMDSGQPLSCSILEITGGMEGYFYGVNILVSRTEPGGDIIGPQSIFAGPPAPRALSPGVDPSVFFWRIVAIIIVVAVVVFNMARC